MTKEERKKEILKAAEEAFLDVGYSNTSMNDVVRRAGMSKRTIYEFFPNKSSLFSRVVSNSLEFPEPRAIPKEANIKHLFLALRERLIDTIKFALSDRQVKLTRLVISESSHSPLLSEAFKIEVIQKAVKYITDGVSIIQKETDSFKNQNPETLAMAMYSMSMGKLHLYSLLGDPDVETMKSISARVDFAMRTVGFVDTSSGDKYEFP